MQIKKNFIPSPNPVAAWSFTVSADGAIKDSIIPISPNRNQQKKPAKNISLNRLPNVIDLIGID